MRKKLCAFLLTLVFMLSIVPTNAYAYTNSNWMGSIDGSKSLTQLSIPGSHDSGAKKDVVPQTQCQSLSIADQLIAGVRYLDIRCRHIDNTFAIHHSIAFEGIYFSDVLTACYDFLKNNPTECIMMSVNEEYTPSNNTRTFEETFNAYIKGNESKWYLGSNIPTLGDARGKIVLMRRFPATNTPKGIDLTAWGTYDDATFTLTAGGTRVKIQDEYVVTFNSDKWDAVKGLLDEAKAYNSTWLYINYSSGHNYLLGIKNVSNYINPKIDTYFDTYTSSKRYGIIAMDFVTSARCLKIIKTNTFK